MFLADCACAMVLASDDGFLDGTPVDGGFGVSIAFRAPKGLWIEERGRLTAPFEKNVETSRSDDPKTGLTTAPINGGLEKSAAELFRYNPCGSVEVMFRLAR